MREEIKTMGIDTLIQKANEIQAKCHDDVFDASELTMSTDLKIKGMDLSSLAQGHLCGKLQVPGRYFTRLVEAKQNELASRNINCWLENDKRKFMLRQYDGHIRGVLSGSYSQFDAPEILCAVKDVFGADKFKVKGSFINEERLHLRLVENEMLPIDGEDLFAGITLDSSDVGRSGLYVRFFIWKQVCTNGLIIAQSHANLFTQKHIGITGEDFRSGLLEGFEMFDQIKEEVTEMIKTTSKLPLPEDIDDIQKMIKDRTKLSDDDVSEVFDMIEIKYGYTKWGMINSITEVAQKFDLERRIELETLAGNMLEA